MTSMKTWSIVGMGVNYYIRMGTNYYIRKDGKEIHLGKSSYGWQFIFQPQLGYYENTRSSINRFLKLNKNDFYDEYDQSVIVEEFWDMVEQKKDGLTLKSYYGYPKCLRFYDSDGIKIIESEARAIIKTDEYERLYNEIPERRSLLEHFMKYEFVSDGLLFHDADFS